MRRTLFLLASFVLSACSEDSPTQPTSSGQIPLFIAVMVFDGYSTNVFCVVQELDAEQLQVVNLVAAIARGHS